MRWIAGLLMVVVGLAVVSVAMLAALPAPIEPVSWTPDPNPGLSGEFAANDKLAGVERLMEGSITGPEDIACADDGTVYTGLEDGRIVQLMADGSHHDVANTGGRPLGMELDSAGRLIVADAKKGLLAVELQTGDAQHEVSVLADSAGGKKIMFADDVDIADDGTIWFSDATATHDFENTIYAFLEGRPSGRLLSYDPATGETTVRMEGLMFANGVALGPDDAYVLVTETATGRIHRLWLKGERAGQRDLFLANLPGTPDNITFNGRDLFWIAMPSLRAPLDSSAQLPWLRKLISHLPKEMLNEGTEPYAFVVAADLDGKVRHNLQNNQQNNLQNKGAGYNMITSATECGGRLYLGSVTQPALARISF